MARIKNSISGVAVEGCCATTHNSASSYGLPVWADADGNAYFQVGADSPFYSVEIDTDEVRRALGAAIRERRLALGLTLDWLGKASGIAASNISKLENGAPGTIDTILKVLSALGAELKLTTTQKH